MEESSDPGTALAMGLLQGATEFLPVSSSGHLAAFAMFFRVPETSLALVVLLHAATLLATLAVFGADLARLLSSFFRGLRDPRALARTPEGRLIASLAVSTAATVATALALRDLVEPWSGVPSIVGICLCGSALAVLTTRGHGSTDRRPEPAADAAPKDAPSPRTRLQASPDPPDEGASGGPSGRVPLSSTDLLGPGSALVVGFVQGLAVLPGLSRSGTTIACAMALGLSAPAAFRYSFLLSIPTVAGATVLELAPGVWAALTPSAWVAAAAALVSGFLALVFLGRVVSRGHLWLFAWYLLPLGLSLILLDLAGSPGN